MSSPPPGAGGGAGPRRRAIDALVGLTIRLGIAPKRFHILTVRGWKSGRPSSIPVIVHAQSGERWLVAPYGERMWVRNARAAGEVTLRRGRRQETAAVEEVGPAEAGPVLKQYLRETPITRGFFPITADAPLEDFVREAPGHPVFRIARLRRRPGG